MAIDPVSGHSPVNPVTPVKSAVPAEKAQQDAEETAAVFERSDQPSAGKLYTRDTVNKLSAELDAKYAGLRSLVEKLLGNQSINARKAAGMSFEQIQKAYNGNLKEFYENLKVDAQTKLQAQRDIAEDGYWGVKQTSQRLIDFAIGLSGGDPSKVAELKAAIEKGFAKAERAWGGALPDICMQTKEAALKGLDAWAAELTQK